MAFDVSEIKQRQRAMWAAGDYPEVSRRIATVADELIAAAGVQDGEDVLDVATGSGNVALPAARTGARVVGLDLTPELLEVAARRGQDAGLEIEWLEGDAEALPFRDDSFDRVLSCFGVMFAPRQEQAAAELVRVCRPGGTIAVTAWTPEGANGEMFRTVGSYLPPPPPEFKPPVLWGNEERVRQLLPGLELELERRRVPFTDDSVEAWMQEGERDLGPILMAKRALEQQGRWDELRADLVAMAERQNTADDGTMHVDAEYLLTVARVPT